MTASHAEQKRAEQEWRRTAPSPSRRACAQARSVLTLRSFVAWLIILVVVAICIFGGFELLIKAIHWINGVAVLLQPKDVAP